MLTKSNLNLIWHGAMTNNKIWGYVKDIRKLILNTKKTAIEIKDSLYNTQNEIRSDFKNLRKNWHNLHNTNLDLAIYHMNNGNINDAILRLKILDFIISPNNERVFALLAFCYFVKGNKTRSLEYINKTSQKHDVFGLKHFLTHNDLAEIPEQIINEYRRICANIYIAKWHSYDIYIPKLFVSSLFKNIEELPASCSILDLGSSAGLIGAELDYKLEKNYTLTGVENVKELTKYTKHNKRNLYDALLDLSVKEFLLQKHNKKYNIITSFCSLDFAKDLSCYFVQIKKILAEGGYFALLLQTDSQNYLNASGNNFVYIKSDIEKQLRLANFDILDIKGWRLSRNIFYNIFIVK